MWVCCIMFFFFWGGVASRSELRGVCGPDVFFFNYIYAFLEQNAF